MASIPVATWASAHTSVSSRTFAAGDTTSATKIFLFPPRRFKPRKAPSASSSQDGSSAEESESPDPVQLAFSKAKAYKEAKSSPPSPAPMTSQKPSPEPEVPTAVKVATEKAKEYKTSKGVSVSKTKDPGQEDLNLRSSRKVWVDDKLNKKDELKISSKDFLGLDFSEKKNYRGKPPGLAPYVSPLLDVDVSEVEIIVGDASKFEITPSPASTSGEVDDNTGLYKPKVSTWGLFPRPNNISKTVVLLLCHSLSFMKKKERGVLQEEAEEVVVVRGVFFACVQEQGGGRRLLQEKEEWRRLLQEEWGVECVLRPLSLSLSLCRRRRGKALTTL